MKKEWETFPAKKLVISTLVIQVWQTHDKYFVQIWQTFNAFSINTFFWWWAIIITGAACSIVFRQYKNLWTLMLLYIAIKAPHLDIFPLYLLGMSSGLEVSQQLLYHGILLLTAHQTANMCIIGNGHYNITLICILLFIL